MAAQIKIESGLTSGTCYWIEKSVTRIGSGSNADICLPSSEIPSHAITLEHRDDTYRVYNRTNRPLHIGDLVISAGESAEWCDGQSIVLPDGTSMLMQQGLDPAVTDQEDDEADIEVDEVEIDDQDTESPAKSNWNLSPNAVKQILLLVSCVVAVFFLLRDSNSSSSTQSSHFDQIIDAGLQDEKTSKILLKRLQYARAALVRRDMEMAQYLFSSLHTELVDQKNQFVAEDRRIELAILNYVQVQANRLE